MKKFSRLNLVGMEKTKNEWNDERLKGDSKLRKIVKLGKVEEGPAKIAVWN